MNDLELMSLKAQNAVLRGRLRFVWLVVAADLVITFYRLYFSPLALCF